MRKILKHLAALSIFSVLALLSTNLHAQAEVKIELTKLTDSVYFLKGQGGNIGFSIGNDGVFMIDDQYAPLSDKIKTAVAGVSTQPVKFLINTHWHGDHTGGNENFAKNGSLIVAHENVRKRMSSDQFMQLFKREVKASPKIALPIVTFTDQVNFHLNGDDVNVIHVPHAHTDGDAIIHFTRANVIHMGDTMFNEMYPFIDTGSGGSITGFIENLENVIARANDDTQIIPGHGPMTNKAGLIGYHAMLADIYSNYQTLKAQGKSLEEMTEIGISKKYDEKYGSGFIKPDVLLKLIDSSKNYFEEKPEMKTSAGVKHEGHEHAAGQKAGMH